MGFSDARARFLRDPQLFDLFGFYQVNNNTEYNLKLEGKKKKKKQRESGVRCESVRAIKKKEQEQV